MYFKDLKKSDHKHLREMGIHSLREFRHVAAEQAKDRARFPKIEPCWDCRRIAKQLDIPVEVK